MPAQPTGDEQPLLEEPSPAQLLEMYTKMCRIRLFNERQALESMRGNILGYMHLYTGMEAAAVGVVSALERGDRITSTHRAEGHLIAAGVSLDRLMAECFGRETGLCRGRAGPMGLADIEHGLSAAMKSWGEALPLPRVSAWR